MKKEIIIFILVVISILIANFSYAEVCKDDSECNAKETCSAATYLCNGMSLVKKNVCTAERCEAGICKEYTYTAGVFSACEFGCKEDSNGSRCLSENSGSANGGALSSLSPGSTCSDATIKPFSGFIRNLTLY
jgi:hypothetical protein